MPHPTETHPTSDTIEADLATAPTVRWDQPPVPSNKEGPMQWRTEPVPEEPRVTFDPTVVAALREQAMFEDFSDEQLQTLAPLFRWERFDADAQMLATGDVSRTLMVVCSGTVEIVPASGNDAPTTRRRGDCIGTTSFVEGSPCSGTVRATSPVLALVTDFDRMAQLPERGDLRTQLRAALSRGMTESSEAVGAPRQTTGIVGRLVAPAMMMVLAGVAARCVLGVSGLLS